MSSNQNSELAEKIRSFHTWFLPVTMVIITVLVKLTELVFGWSLYRFGVYPREFKGIAGIFMAPLIHADWSHLIANAIPMLVLGTGLFYYYRQHAHRIFWIIYFSTGAWVWLSARPAYHIGSSGVVYGLAAFLFLSGVLKKNANLSAFALIVVFLYGSMIWGILPLFSHVSWESHLMGLIAGVVMAFFSKKLGPEEAKYEWQNEKEETEMHLNEEELNSVNENSSPESEDKTVIKVLYHFSPAPSDVSNDKNDDTGK